MSLLCDYYLLELLIFGFTGTAFGGTFRVHVVYIVTKIVVLCLGLLDYTRLDG